MQMLAERLGIPYHQRARHRGSPFGEGIAARARRTPSFSIGHSRETR
jgi:hypothetical protein